MGQFALGIRSLLVKATIFVVLAALLAWALGGTLFPKPETSDLDYRAVSFGGDTMYYWRVLVGGKKDGEIRWHLMSIDSAYEKRTVEETQFVEVAGPIATTDGLYYAGRTEARDSPWRIVKRDAAGATKSWPMPDRLAVEQQLARVASGLPLQDSATITQQRSRVLDPAADRADE